MSQISVVLCDRQQLIRSALRTLLDKQPEFKVVGDAGEGRAVVSMVDRLEPDVVIIDTDLPSGNGVAVIRQLADTKRRKRPGILVLTLVDHNRYAFAALRAGANGILLKGSLPDELFAGIHAIAAGQGVITHSVAGPLLELVRPYLPDIDEAVVDDNALTPRELEVLRLIAVGNTSVSVARRLGVSTATVRSHVHHLLTKLNLEDRAQLVVYAYKSGLVTSGQ